MSEASTRSATAGLAGTSLADDVRYYLSLQPKQLPSKYLYDSLGSALFDAIVHLPWYSPCRAETRLLRAHAARVLDSVPGLTSIAELGPGNGEKLLTLILGRARPQPLDLHLVDVSASALARAADALTRLPGVTVVPYEDTYEAGLQRYAAERRDGRTLALFLGSNIGNFDAPARSAFLGGLRAALRTRDAVLLGVDLIKPEPQLLLAYDDPLGVTAAFNLNLLVRINRELDSDFDLGGFAHRAVWNAERSRVEMHLVSRRAQTVRVPRASLELHLDEGEIIWTESSYKFRPNEVVDLLHEAGFEPRAQWIDDGEPFALTLAEAR